MANMTNADRDQIVMNATAFGMSMKENAAATGWTESAVSVVLNTLDMVKQEAWEKLAYKVMTSGYGVPCIEWAADRTRKNVPESIYDAVKKRAASPTGKVPAPKPVPEPDDPNNDAFYVNVLTTLNAIQQSNIAIIDALSALAADLKDNRNINTDLVCQQLKNIARDVETLKNNTRKKGL